MSFGTQENIIKQMHAGKLFLTNKNIDNNKVIWICSQEYTYNINMLLLGLNNLNSEGMVYFKQAKWDNLIELLLSYNSIGDLGCKYITKATFNKIRDLGLSDNMISNAGLLHLAKTQWTSIKSVYLDRNYIGSINANLIKSNWPKLQCLNLSYNQISIQQMKNLLVSSVKKMTQLKLQSNRNQLKDENVLTQMLRNKFGFVQIYL